MRKRSPFKKRKVRENNETFKHSIRVTKKIRLLSRFIQF